MITMDLHAGQIQGFFNIPVDNLFSAPVLIDYIMKQILKKDIVVVSPDAGGVERARAFAKRLDAGPRRLSTNAESRHPTRPRPWPSLAMWLTKRLLYKMT